MIWAASDASSYAVGSPSFGFSFQLAAMDFERLVIFSWGFTRMITIRQTLWSGFVARSPNGNRGERTVAFPS